MKPVCRRNLHRPRPTSSAEKARWPESARSERRRGPEPNPREPKQRESIPWCPREDDAFVPLPFFRRRIRVWGPFFSGFHALAVNDRGAWRRLAARCQAYVLAQTIVNLLPNSATSPFPIIVVNRSPWGEIMRQHTPRTARAIEVKHRVDNLSHFNRAGSAA